MQASLARSGSGLGLQIKIQLQIIRIRENFAVAVQRESLSVSRKEPDASDKHKWIPAKRQWLSYAEIAKRKIIHLDSSEWKQKLEPFGSGLETLQGRPVPKIQIYSHSNRKLEKYCIIC